MTGEAMDGEVVGRGRGDSGLGWSRGARVVGVATLGPASGLSSSKLSSSFSTSSETILDWSSCSISGARGGSMSISSGSGLYCSCSAINSASSCSSATSGSGE